jgi:hypothetical protein
MKRGVEVSTKRRITSVKRGPTTSSTKMRSNNKWKKGNNNKCEDEKKQ